MPKQEYRVRNWKEYNKALIHRGSITLWVEEASIQGWYEVQPELRGRGRPCLYSDISIRTMLILKQVYRLSLRASQGFMESLIRCLKLPIKAPCYTQVCRRQGAVKLPKLPTLSGSIHMVIDATGLKVFGEGEWKVRQHGYGKHRTWRKLHIGVDENSQLIVSALLTENNCGDNAKLPELLTQYKGRMDQVSADGAYDSHACFDEIARYGARATIPTQPNPRHKSKRWEDLKSVRDEVFWQIQEKGRKEWKQESGYHRRSLVENAFYRYKQILGDKLASRKLENQCTEAMVRCYALNRMTLLGTPISKPIPFN